MTMLEIQPLEAVETARIPLVDVAEFRRAILAAVSEGSRIAALYGMPEAEGGGAGVRLMAVLADDAAGRLRMLSCGVDGAYPSLTPECAQAGGFEREIAEQWGVRPEGHPWLKPLRFHAPYRAAAEVWAACGNGGREPSVMDFFHVEGDGIHEVAVGPVHAGIIEPGHFRFQCHGEQVLHLEISLGYQHRGVERALTGGPHARSIHHIETLAGDTTAGHGMAYCRAMEALAGCEAPPRAEALRAVALELERLANHTGDLGALAGDVGFLPTASFCGRLRGDFLNMTAMLCGNRFSRNLLRPGGVAYDVTPTLAAELVQRLNATFRDVGGAAELLWKTSSVLARFENTGTVSAAVAEELGLVGPAARASGLSRDVRRQYPAGGAYYAPWPVAVQETGDVFARATVRWMEIRQSVEFIRRRLAELPEGEARVPCGAPAANRTVVSLTEGWRGEIVHVAHTDAAGRFARYKVADPSFHNWMGLAMALRGQEISDFPLCNKSFNLSYCGHDL